MAAAEMEVAEANWPSLMFFLACDTQWRVITSLGGLIWIGLDYTACDVVARRMQIPDYAWLDLKTMESAALPALNEKPD
jgi:hypothetical protein